jgi:hypothetical protein
VSISVAVVSSEVESRTVSLVRNTRTRELTRSHLSGNSRFSRVVRGRRAIAISRLSVKLTSLNEAVAAHDSVTTRALLTSKPSRATKQARK